MKFVAAIVLLAVFCKALSPTTPTPTPPGPPPTVPPPTAASPTAASPTAASPTAASFPPTAASPETPPCFSAECMAQHQEEEDRKINLLKSQDAIPKVGLDHPSAVEHYQKLQAIISGRGPAGRGPNRHLSFDTIWRGNLVTDHNDKFRKLSNLTIPFPFVLRRNEISGELMIKVDEYFTTRPGLNEPWRNAATEFQGHKWTYLYAINLGLNRDEEIISLEIGYCDSLDDQLEKFEACFSFINPTTCGIASTSSYKCGWVVAPERTSTDCAHGFNASRPTTEAACISLAAQHGMSFSDSGPYPTKGCYYYQSGPGSITAQFGTGGNLTQMTQMVYTVGQHRFPCQTFPPTAPTAASFRPTPFPSAASFRPTPFPSAASFRPTPFPSAASFRPTPFPSATLSPTPMTRSAPVNCTTIDEINATLAVCGVVVPPGISSPTLLDISIDKSKACSTACHLRVEAIVESCDDTVERWFGGNVTEVMAAINSACDSPLGEEVSSFTLVTPGVFGLIFAAFLQL